MFRFCKAWSKLLILLFAGISAPLVIAQEKQKADTLLVNAEPIVIEGEEALTLGIYFTVLDQNRDSLPDVEIESADILLQDGIRYPATVSKPDTPLFIALTLDFSGSMADSEQAMREAAARLIDEAPPEANISIIRFDEEISQIPFTNNRAVLQTELARMGTEGKGTCLYDAAFQAIEQVNLMAGEDPLARKTVVLFTDGQDERTAGVGDTCSVHTFSEVVELARSSGTPIHTIGLLGQNGVSADELEGMAQSSSGLTAIGERADLNALFTKIIDGLRGQFFVQADMYPRQGENTATLTVELRDDTRLTTSVLFNSSRDYNPPPLPLELLRTNLVYDEIADNFSFSMDMGGTTDEIAGIQLLIKGENGTQVAEYSFDGFAPPLTFPATGLIPQERHSVEIYAVNDAGGLIRSVDDDPILGEVRFEYTPPQEEVLVSSITLKPIDVDPEAGQLILETQVENPEQIAAYEVQIVNRETGDLAQTLTADFGSNPLLTVPVSELTAGKYLVIVNANNANGAVISTSEQEISYTPPAAPGIFSRIISALISAWYILAAIIFIIFLVIAWLMTRSILEKRNTGTPFLQGKGIQPAAQREMPINHTMIFGQESGGDHTIVDRPQAQPTALRLQVAKAANADIVGKTFTVQKFPFSIGRENCDLTLTGDRHVSRRHAEITKHGDFVYITDAGSSNGVTVNGQPITAHTPTKIQSGTQIGIGQTTQLELN